MNDNYSRILTRCLALSCMGLLAVTWFPVHPVIPFVFGILPLMWYHLYYLRPMAKTGLSQAAIDSVYYYGFLVTIAALGASSVQLAVQGIQEDFTAVAFQFGLGLLATGYAVWARLHLTAVSKEEEGTPEEEEILDRYLIRSRELVTNVELATSSFKAFAEKLTDESAAFANRAQSDVNDSIKAAADKFRAEVSSMAEEGRTAFSDLRGLVNDVTFGAERDEMRKSVRSIVTSVTTLNKGMDELAMSTRVGAESVGSLASALSGIDENAAAVAGKLGNLAEEHGPLARLTSSVESGAAGLDEAGQSIRRTWEAVNGAASSIGGTVEKLAGMEELAGDARSKVAALAKSLAKVESLAVGVESASEGLKELAAHATQSGEAAEALQRGVASLQSTLTALNDTLKNSSLELADSMTASSGHIDQTLATSTRSVELLTNRLSSIADFIIDRTSKTATAHAAV